MADINIQRKKTAPSPWILVILVAAVAVAAYFFLRPDPADEPTPANTVVPVLADTVAFSRLADSARAVLLPSVSADSLAKTQDAEDYSPATLAVQAATDPVAPDYALNGLQKLTGVLVALTDRDDLRDPNIMEQRDNLTSATNRLGEANASLRPGFVAATGLIQAMQQKAYPDLAEKVNALAQLSSQLSGRNATAFDQQQNKQFLTQAAAIVRVLSEPPH